MSITQDPITPLHIERGRQMRAVVMYDIGHRGLTMEAAVDSLATHLGVEPETVKLAIAIANDADEAICRYCPEPVGRCGHEQ